MAEKAVSNYSYEAYLALEAESDIRHEYHDGFIVAMAGGTPEHSLIIANFIGEARNAISKASKRCLVFSSDLKIRIENSNRTFYPDASITCQPPIKSDKDPHAILNPDLILEVLSESTEGFDRGAKFEYYRQIPTFKELILVSQNEAKIDCFFKKENGLWEIATLRGLGKKLYLKSINCEIDTSLIYKGIPDLNPTFSG